MGLLRRLEVELNQRPSRIVQQCAAGAPRCRDRLQSGHRHHRRQSQARIRGQKGGESDKENTGQLKRQQKSLGSLPTGRLPFRPPVFPPWALPLHERQERLCPSTRRACSAYSLERLQIIFGVGVNLLKGVRGYQKVEAVCLIHRDGRESGWSGLLQKQHRLDRRDGVVEL
jgi:hypothetical protein